MPHRFEAMPLSVMETDAKATAFLLAWRDWMQARQQAAADLSHANQDRLANCEKLLRQAFGDLRAQFRYLQQLRHIRGGALRSPLPDQPELVEVTLPDGTKAQVSPRNLTRVIQ